MYLLVARLLFLTAAQVQPVAPRGTLYEAGQRGDVRTARALLDRVERAGRRDHRDAAVNERADNHANLLHLAVTSARPRTTAERARLVRRLIDAGVKADAVDHRGRTPRRPKARDSRGLLRAAPSE